MRTPLAIAIAITVIFTTGCVSAPAIQTPPFDPSLLPRVPTAAAVDGADPQTRASSLVALTSDEEASTDTGWLAAYAAVGIPVLDSREPNPAIDPVGPRWSQVWSLSALSRGGATLTLTDVAVILSEAQLKPITGDAVLQGLRESALNTDERRATIALFVAGKSVSNGGANPLDPASTADTVDLDAATIQLLAWEYLRTALEGAGEAERGAASGGSFGIQSVVYQRDGGSGTPCSEVWGTQDATSWINWIANKVGGPAAEKLAGETIGKYLSAANIIASVLSLVAQVNALTATTSSEPSILIRNRLAQPGGEATVGFRLEFDASLLDANNQALCALITTANAAGVGLSLPADGATISGAELTLTPIKNFPDKIYLANGADLRRITTNAAGVATVLTQGRARKADLPPTAKEKPDEYGFAISAQVEESGAQSILNLFIDGLTFAGGGVISGVLDAVKLFKFDIGEAYLPFIDYESGYRVEQVWLGGYRISGEVCDLERPFQLQLDGSAISAFTGPLLITPLAEPTVSYSIQGLFGGILPGVGNGNGFFRSTEDRTELFLDGGYFETTAPPPVGTIPVGPNGQHFSAAASDPIILTPDPTACTGQP